MLPEFGFDTALPGSKEERVEHNLCSSYLQNGGRMTIFLWEINLS